MSKLVYHHIFLPYSSGGHNICSPCDYKTKICCKHTDFTQSETSLYLSLKVEPLFMLTFTGIPLLLWIYKSVKDGRGGGGGGKKDMEDEEQYNKRLLS